MLDQCWELVDFRSRCRITRTQCVSNVAGLDYHYIVLDLDRYCDVGSMLYFPSYIIYCIKIIIWKAVIVCISVMRLSGGTSHLIDIHLFKSKPQLWLQLSSNIYPTIPGFWRHAILSSFEPLTSLIYIWPIYVYRSMIWM